MANKWTLDASHSEVTFKVKHMMIAHTTGNFNAFNVEADSDNDEFSQGKAHFTADVKSISTGDEKRDGHLISADFFDVENFPQIEFVSTEIGNGKLKGNLTIKGTTKAVELDLEFGGVNKDPWGNMRAGFTVTGKINRKDFGLTWNVALETGGILVGEEVKIQAEIQLIKS